MSGCINLRLRLRPKLYQLEIAFDKVIDVFCTSPGIASFSEQARGTLPSGQKLKHFVIHPGP